MATKSKRQAGPGTRNKQQRQDSQSARDDDPRANGHSERDTRAPGDPGQGPGTQGTLSSGYSSRSSTGGTGGGVLTQRGSGYSPGAQSRVGASDSESDDLTREGVAAGAAGMGESTPPLDSQNREESPSTDTHPVGGVAGESSGGSPTTSRTTRDRR